MSTESHNLLTIDELAAEVAATVSSVGQASGRVSEVPSRRTIRYYSTHGLLDRPVEFRGRTALYGTRHVLQLVAIKQMQARGLALSQIQARMIGLSDTQLAELAGAKQVSKTPAIAEEAREEKEEDSFWRREPVQAEPKVTPAPEPTNQISGVRLDDDIVLMIENATRDLHVDDLAAIRVAAEPLMKLLRARHLVRQPRSNNDPQR